MIFFDINTFYYASDGGVKTFYNAKINWFKQHPEHQYYLVFPNSEFKVEKIAPNVTTVQVYGLKGVIGKNRLLMLDYWKVLKLIRKVKPDVLEVGDPLVSSFFSLFIKRTGIFKGLLSSFHHSDVINTYVNPWAYGETTNLFKRMVARLCKAVYLSLHRRYPYSMVASHTLKGKLQVMGIDNIVVKPFGVQEQFFEGARVRKKDEKRLLFAGRLEHEKGIHLLKEILPRLLDQENIKVTIMGKGAHESFFKNYQHPSLEYLGYVADRDKVEKTYRENTIFLAPGPFETFGIGVLEAMVNGMLVVGPNQGGTGELLSSMDSPFIFEAHDAESFYKSIIDALNADIEAESRRAVEHSVIFSTWDNSISRMMHYYIEKASARPVKEVNEQQQESPDFAT